MEKEPIVKLQVLVGDELLGVAEAAKRFPDSVSEAINAAFHTITKIALDSVFLKSLQVPRPKRPYRLNAVAASCKQKRLPDDSLEMRFYSRGGVKALIALAVALADNKTTAALLGSLPDDDLTTWIDSILDTNVHEDINYIRLSAERSDSSKLATETYLPGTRSSAQQAGKAAQRHIAKPRTAGSPSQPASKRPRTSAQPSLHKAISSAEPGSRSHASKDAHHPQRHLEWCEADQLSSADSGAVWDDGKTTIGGLSHKLTSSGNFRIDLDTLRLDFDFRNNEALPQHFGNDLEHLSFS
ncbi:hypothetical protein F5883DRAFT_700361 [Diaporthe sp. PMI_573]|nr:hypothetical protein F5883DRAFT_700361 [Diaporthaceae sp. PMI_573]